MHSDGGRIEIMIYNKADKVLTHCLLDIKFSWKIHWNAVTLSLMVFFYCITDVKKGLNRGASYTDSPHWIKIKWTINPINNDKKCLRYFATVTINHEEIWKNQKE